jgi:hybrid cluster-associated redox disulfide protein
MEISKDMKISELIEKYPKAIEVLMESGMHCFGCGMAAMETIEQAACSHGIDCDELIEKIKKTDKE